MKRLLSTSLVTAACIALAACGQTGAANYRVVFEPTLTPDKVQEVATGAARVIQRRVDAMKGTVKNINVQTKEKEATITSTVDPPALVSPLTDQLSEAFTLRIMRSTNPGESPDMTVQGDRNFNETGVTEKDILWVTASKNEKEPTKGTVLVTFNDEGKKKLKKVFKATRGKQVALFLRGRLVSSFTNTSGAERENILIEGIPSADLAAAFADDVNVGVYAKIVPNR